MSILLRDTKFALRQFWKHPGFSLTGILSLAFGIAATVVIFSVIYNILFHPEPYPDADRIVIFVDLKQTNEVSYTPSIYREQIAQIKTAHSIQDVVEMNEQNLSDTTMDIPQDVDAVYFSGNAFPFFGIPAMLGRTFLPSDAPPGQAPQPVAVLAYQYWQRRFNSDSAIVGKSLRLDNRTYTILGVMPRNFTWWDCDVYLPLDTSDASVRRFMTVLRIKQPYTKAEALEELRPILQQMIREHPHSSFEGMDLQLMSTGDRFARNLGPTLYVLFAAVLLLLIISCLNVSILLLARATARQHEFALRAAVGATAGRIIRQLFTESLLLGVLGALLGILLTYATTPLAAAMLPWQLFTRGVHIPVRVAVLAFCAGLAIVTSILFGLFPAIHFAQPRIRQTIQASSPKAAGSFFGRRIHSVFIAGQIALSMILLTVALSAIANFRQLLHLKLGYDPDHVADASIPIHSGSYATREARASYYQQLRDRIAQLPGVRSASLGVIGPPSSGGWDFPFEILGAPALRHRTISINFVDSAYFQTLRIPLIQGRLWEESETRRGAHLVIVNQAFARQYFPNQDVLGHSVRVPDLVNHPPAALAVDGSDGWATIIGVVGDARNAGIDSAIKPEIYFPYSFYMIDWVKIFIRSEGDPLAHARDIRRQVASLNPGQQISDPITPLREVIQRESTWARAHLIAVLSSVFSALALLISSVGLYSVVSYSVGQRFNELGVRMALGALRRHILLSVLKPVAISVGSGLLIGLVLSLTLQRGLAHWLGSLSISAFLLILVCLILATVALAASVMPALRASLIRPMDALRNE